MTRKHFAALAAALHRAIPLNATESDMIVWAACCVQVASACRAANPAFDKSRFLDACNGK